MDFARPKSSRLKAAKGVPWQSYWAKRRVAKANACTSCLVGRQLVCKSASCHLDIKLLLRARICQTPKCAGGQAPLSRLRSSHRKLHGKHTGIDRLSKFACCLLHLECKNASLLLKVKMHHSDCLAACVLHLHLCQRCQWFCTRDFQPDCLADQLVAGPRQPTASPKAQTQKRKACCCVARGNQIQLGR
eukprot:1154572-Pelagomonas_calceolata.AAC.1